MTYENLGEDQSPNLPPDFLKAATMGGEEAVKDLVKYAILGGTALILASMVLKKMTLKQFLRRYV